MICELQIKLVSKQVSALYYSNHFVYEIERVCDSKDRYKLFEAYTASLIYAANHDATIDSSLINVRGDDNFGNQTVNR